MRRNIVITGGAGFIGSHVVRLFVNKYPEYKIINLDKLTYAGNLANLKDIEVFSFVVCGGIWRRGGQPAGGHRASVHN